MEDGTIVLVGATTENPSFELIAPLLSRARVLVFKSLDETAVEKLLHRAEAIEGKKLPLDDQARASLIRMADGDGRAALTLTEEVWRAARQGETFDAAALQQVVQRRAPIYDKKQDGHYNLISALHKSVRGSDADAALYYLCRMLDAGEDPLYLARRIVRMAVEDIGLADPQALVVANAAKEAYDFLGSPEGELAIAEALIYVATAPKSNATYLAFGEAMRTAKAAGSLLPPKHVLNAPTKLMKAEGYGSGYEYDHDAPDAFSGQDYFPEALGRKQFYDPPERGFEREIKKRLDYWTKLRRERSEIVRGSRGPRHPGGGRQMAGPRDQQRHKQRQFRPAEGAPRGSAPRKPGKTIGKPGGKPGARPSRPGPAKFGNGGRRPERPARAPFEAKERRAPQEDAQRRETPPPAPQLPTSVQNVTVTADENGMRVDRFFEARFPGLSFSHIQRVIRKGEVRVNGKRTEPKGRLEAGQTVRIPPLRLDAPKARTMGNAADQKTADFLKSITLYEDADVLVLNKPMGLAVQGGSGTTRHLDGMLEVLRDAHGQRPRLVHRLDKDTAGCLLVAKTRFAASALAKTFRSRSARKIYWALVAGVPKLPQGRISTFLAKEEREDESFMRIAKHGEKGASHAITYYAVVETSGRALAWISLKPVTGRTHQLRAHMSHIDHPIVGDPKYFSIENWELPGGMQDKLHLLARRIAVPHPRGGVIDVTAPLPPHMLQSWNLLGLDAKRYDPIEDAPEE